MASIVIQMDLFMKENGFRIKCKGKVNSIMRMGFSYMMVNGRKMNLMVMEYNIMTYLKINRLKILLITQI